MKIFKCEAQGDVLYFKAETKDKARDKLFKIIGEIPDELLKWTEVNKVPKGEQVM